MDASDRKTDIIIPVYNALQELKQCAASVLKWTDLTRHRLILINDNSSDGRVRMYLDSLRREHARENILVIHNQENRGFSRNINIGMAQSPVNDVLLLNSDTVVTKNWLEKLMACAYASRSIATVTPLSNNASLCSVPGFCMENEIPDGYTLDGYAALIEDISLRRYPTIPVANGFCMYIKREVIRQIGNFDAAAFEKGYGEENDFCYRAIQAGWHHVMCDDTFIFHSGTRSFDSAEKRKNIQEHEKILDRRYPKLMQDVRIYCRDNPNAAIAENVKLGLEWNARGGRRTILYLLQSDFRDGARDNVGGTQLHVRDLVMGLRGRYDMVVAARDGSCLNVTLYTQEKERLFCYAIESQQDQEIFRSEEMAVLYRRILENFRVDAVHIHHTKGLTLELFYEAEKKSIPVLVTLHDYYYLCPNIKLLDHENKPCAWSKGKDMAASECKRTENEQHCRICLQKQAGIAQTVPYLSVWREENHRALSLAKCIFVPSESARQIIAGCFGSLREKLQVAGHGMGPFLRQPSGIPDQAVPDKKIFRVAFLGGISTAKGYRHAVTMIRKSGRNIHWYLFGTFEREDSFLEKRDNFFNIGKYNREELPYLLQTYAIDLVCILSLWPETFCYTISEAVSSGVPVLVTDIGALGERVRALGCGWIVPVQASSAQILAKIYEIRKNRTDYKDKKNRIHRIRLLTAEEMCGFYDQEYRKVLLQDTETAFTAGQKRHDESVKETVGQVCHDGSIQETTGRAAKEVRTAAENVCQDWNYNPKWLLEGAMAAYGAAGWSGGSQMENRLREAEHHISVIENSFTYRLLRMIAGMNLPFRDSIREFLRSVYRTAIRCREWTEKQRRRKRSGNRAGVRKRKRGKRQWPCKY